MGTKTWPDCGICGERETEEYRDCCVNVIWCPSCGSLRKDVKLNLDPAVSWLYEPVEEETWYPPKARVG